MNRRHHALLAPLLAVLALLLGLAQSASAAFNAAATDPHYGIFLPQLSEAPARMPLEIADPTRENGVWLYDSTLGVPVYVQQNPWTYYDPDGLFISWLAEKAGERYGSNPVVDWMAPKANTVVNSTQGTLMAASAVPGLGKAADVMSAAITAADGDYSDAGVVLIGGVYGKAASKIKKGLNVMEGSADVSKIIKKGGEQIKKNGDALVTTARETSEQTLKQVDEVTSTAGTTLNGGNRIDPTKVAAPPPARGKAPIGADGTPIELHHTDQTKGNASPLDEMTRTDHRGAGSYKENHPNTGQTKSTVDRTEFNKIREEHWKQEWDSDRFK